MKALALKKLEIRRADTRFTEPVTSRISHTTIDSRNAYQQSLWWSQVLGMREDPQDPNEPGDEECMIFSANGRTRLLFVEVPEAKQIKNRLHFDLRPTDATRDEEVTRVLVPGAAQVADRRRPDGSGWVTLTDPEGNEFCILRSDSEFSDPYAHLVT
jgi:catechol 2,3-dioxygenase-like lactoylglutathione lyase family enzyme